MKREIYTCKSCNTQHSTINNFNECEICRNTICVNCAKLLEIKGNINIMVHKDGISTEDKEYKSFVVCPSCYEKYSTQVDQYNVKLIEATDKFIDSLRRVRERYLLGIINTIREDFKRYRKR